MRVKIYQINSNRDKAHFRFSNLAETTKLMQGNGVDSSLYDEVFNAELGTGDLEEIYTKFNIERHSLFVISTSAHITSSCYLAIRLILFSAGDEAKSLNRR